MKVYLSFIGAIEVVLILMAHSGNARGAFTTHSTSLVSEKRHRCNAMPQLYENSGKVCEKDIWATKDRRNFLMAPLIASLAVGSAAALLPNFTAMADDNLPMVTTKEFESILKSSSKSVQFVEFSGPKSETAVVKLVDGTVFGISDLIESSVDPRSPLRLVATLRGYNVPYKFLMLEAAVGSASTRGKRKVYLNEATIIANKKTEDKKDRIAKDEEERLAEIQKIKGDAAATNTE